MAKGMKVKVLETSGFEAAIEGVRLSYGSNHHSDSEWDDTNSMYWGFGPKDIKLLDNLIRSGPSHSKFMRQLQVWLDITSTRDWWIQAATYKVATTDQSESTMHTLTKRTLTDKDFVDGVDSRSIDIVNEYIKEGDLIKAKKNLPEGFLQRRIVNLNYQVLRNMYHQRYNHKLPQWKEFFDQIFNSLPYYHFIILGKNK